MKPTDGRYGVWAGRPGGVPENKTRCAEEIGFGDRAGIGRQCARRRGYGLDGQYCKQHAKREPR